MSVVIRFTDGSSFELIEGQTTYGVTGLFLGSGLYPFDKYDYDGNHWYINNDASYLLPTFTNNSLNFVTGTFPNINYGCFFTYIRPDNYLYYLQAERPAYTSTIPTSGRYVYTGESTFAMPYYAESVNIWGGIRLSESLIRSYLPLSTADITYYPITYSSSNSTVSGPSEAAVGDTVTVSAVPDVGYGITDASTQILVTNNDVAVPYTWDAANQRITFTMPDPS